MRARTHGSAHQTLSIACARALGAVLTSARTLRGLGSWLCGARWRWWCRAGACDRNARRSCSKTSCPLSTRYGGQAGQAGDCCYSSSPYPPAATPPLLILFWPRTGARWMRSGTEVGMGVSKLVLDMGIVTGLACSKRSCGCLMIRRVRPSSPGVCVGMCVCARGCAVVCGGVQVRLRAACVCGCVAPLPSGRHTNRESTCTVFVAVLTAGFGG